MMGIRKDDTSKWNDGISMSKDAMIPRWDIAIGKMGIIQWRSRDRTREGLLAESTSRQFEAFKWSL